MTLIDFRNLCFVKKKTARLLLILKTFLTMKRNELFTPPPLFPLGRILIHGNKLASAKIVSTVIAIGCSNSRATSARARRRDDYLENGANASRRRGGEETRVN